MNVRSAFLKSVLVAGMAASTCALAQQPVLFANLSDAMNASKPARSASPSSNRPTPPADPSPLSTKIDRWVDLNEFAFSFRYRKEINNNNFALFDNGQQKSVVDGRFKFDRAANYTISYHISSGRTFNWAYADEIAANFSNRDLDPANFASLTPAQLGVIVPGIAADPEGYALGVAFNSRGWAMNVRQLYFRAMPVKQLAFEYGSLGIDKGISTEATTYDDDGYITGERVRLLDPKHLFFDQITFTNAYEGDLNAPSFFKRGQRLKEANYRQFLAAKQFGKRFQISADYTFDKSTHTVHEAAFVKIPEVKAIDSVRVELYHRLNDVVVSGAAYHAHSGFAATGTKTFYKKFQLDGGYAHIDYDYGVLTGYRVPAAVGFSMNGDSFLTGNRAFSRANWKVTPGINLYGFYTHTTSKSPPADVLFNNEGLNGGMTVDLKALLTKAKVL